MKWVITGGCGFIGKSLVKLLMSEKGNSIRVVDNLSVGTRDTLGWGHHDFNEVSLSKIPPFRENEVDLIIVDIMDENAAVEVTKDADIIVHLAANTGVGPSVDDPRSDCKTNVIGTFNFLEAARINNVKRFVFASSGAPIGECVPPIHEEMPAHPVSPYGASKLAGEGYCSAYHKTFGVETVALRFGNVYGPGSTHKSSVVAKFIRLAMSGETLEVYGNGKQTRDFIYLDDLLDAVYKAATVKDIGGEIFQIATNKETTVNEIVKTMLPLLQDRCDHKIEVIYGDERLGDVLRNFSDTSKASKILNWEAKIGIETGIQSVINEYITEW